MVRADKTTHSVAEIVAGLFVALSVLMSIYIIWKHLTHWTEPLLQRPIVRILLMVPIYSIDSLISLIEPQYALYFDTLRDCYEAYVLYQFFKLLVVYLGGDANLRAILEGKEPMKHPIPLCFIKQRLGSSFLHRCKQMILQFVVVKPCISMTAIILNLGPIDKYHEGSFSPSYGYLWFTIIDNISITLSMYYLVLFYQSLKDDLKPFRPVPKFLCIKAVIFFSFWQGVVISVLVAAGIITRVESLSTDQIATGLQDLLICIEMFAISIAHAYAFGYPHYREEYSAEKVSLLGEFGGLVDPRRLRGHVASVRENFVPAVRRFADVANPRDTWEETLQTFTRAAPRHVVVGDWSTLDTEQKKLRVVKQGWMWKLGDELKNWKYRCFLLISNPVGLAYYDTDPFDSANDVVVGTKTPRGSVNLNLADDVHEAYVPPASTPASSAASSRVPSGNYGTVLAGTRVPSGNYGTIAPPPTPAEELVDAASPNANNAAAAGVSPPSSAHSSTRELPVVGTVADFPLGFIDFATVQGIELIASDRHSSARRLANFIGRAITRLSRSGDLPSGGISANDEYRRASTGEMIKTGIRITTPERVWMLSCETPEDAREWYEALERALEDFKASRVDLMTFSVRHQTTEMSERETQNRAAEDEQRTPFIARHLRTASRGEGSDFEESSTETTHASTQVVTSMNTADQNV